MLQPPLPSFPRTPCSHLASHLLGSLTPEPSSPLLFEGGGEESGGGNTRNQNEGGSGGDADGSIEVGEGVGGRVEEREGAEGLRSEGEGLAGAGNGARDRGIGLDEV